MMGSPSKVVFIYGPPAAGKLTVANELSKRTGWRVFHNHLSFDLAASIFPGGSPDHAVLVEQIRLLAIEAAVVARVNLIFTFVYGHPHDLPFVEKVEAVADRAGSCVCFVQLTPQLHELERRVTLPSRSTFEKVRDVRGLREIMQHWDLAIHDSDLRIDNTSLPAVEVAEMIERHCLQGP